MTGLINLVVHEREENCTAGIIKDVLWHILELNHRQHEKRAEDDKTAMMKCEQTVTIDPRSYLNGHQSLPERSEAASMLHHSQVPNHLWSSELEWRHSSVVEHSTANREVTGSVPVVPFISFS